jgi:cation diffusion facilitator family transporter
MAGNMTTSSNNAAKRPATWQGERMGAASLSLVSNLLLTVMKIVVGIFTGSVSILAEAAHSLSDLLASGLTLVSVRAAELPPDKSHPYGHGKAESLSALAESLLLFVAAAFIIYEAVSRLLSHTKPERLGWGIAVMAAAAVVNVFVVRAMLVVAERTGSQALRADAENHRADIYAAAGVFVGLMLVRITGHGFFDPVLAILVSLLIIRTAYTLAAGALAPLMDSQLPRAEVDAVRRVLDADPSVLAYHKLRTRQAGAERFVDAHVLMDDELTLAEAHGLTEDVEQKVREVLPNTEVTLHTEPYHAERQHQHEQHNGLPISDDHPCEIDRDRL